MHAQQLVAGLVIFIAQTTAALCAESEFNVVVEYVQANGNELETISGEVPLVATIVRKDITVKLNTEDDQIIRVNASGLQSEEETERLKNVLKSFISLRCEGHTFQYAFYKANPNSPIVESKVPAYLKGNPSVLEHVAGPWIRPDLNTCVSFPTLQEGEVRAPLYVLDGDLAWVYVFQKQSRNREEPKPVLSFRFDALEFAPGASDVIRRTFKELESRGLTPTANKEIGAKWWFELQAKLKSGPELLWRTPQELNPETLFD